jgi:hypothetical protein
LGLYNLLLVTKSCYWSQVAFTGLKGAVCLQQINNTPAMTTNQINTTPQSEKLFYIDKIRIVLTILVILHHACVSYGGPDGWYYNEAITNKAALTLITMFLSLNQSFFMGFFFLLAAYFTYSSYQKKGRSQFIKDRLLRLGLPLVFYSFIFSPFVSYLVYNYGKGNHINYLSYLSVFDSWIDFGVLWFVAALLIFTLVYVYCKEAFKRWTQKALPAPGLAAILVTAVAIGLLSFVVRIGFPVNWSLKFFGFKLGHFPQYISLFTIGLLAAKNNWLAQLDYKMGKKMKRIALCSLFMFPVFYLIRTQLNLPIAWYMGGFNWLSLLYAVWEQFIGFALITAFLAIGKERWNSASTVTGYLSRSSFATYIFHPLALVVLSLLVRTWAVDPTIKLLIVGPLGVVTSFLIGQLVVSVPGVKRIV